MYFFNLYGSIFKIPLAGHFRKGKAVFIPINWIKAFPSTTCKGGSMNTLDSTRRHIKSYEELDFTDDFMFCKIMENNADLCKELAELILGRQIGKIMPVESQKAIEITADGKGVRFDVYMEDDAQTLYDIEMQQVTARALPKRMRYYQGMIDLNQMERGAKYEDLKNSYIIFICCNQPFSDSSRHIYFVKNECEGDPPFDYSDGAYKIILSAEGEEDDISEDMRQFLLYLKEKKTESVFTKRLQMEVDEARQHKKWRVEYMNLLERDERMREEGREEGLEIGLVKGSKLKTLEIVRNYMKNKEKSAEEAFKDLAIPENEREELLAELEK